MSKKLAKKTKAKKKDAGLEVVESLIGYIMPIFAMILCVFIPLYMKEGYFKIGTAKYRAYQRIVEFGMPILLLLILLWVIFWIRQDGRTVFSLANLKKQLSLTDCFVLAYLLASLLSYFTSAYRSEAFWGYDGWFMGLFSQITFVLLYFIYSRFGSGWQITLGCLCTISVYVFFMGILHRLLIDPLGVYDNISDYYKTQFLSTLGQASWYSSFICTVMGLGIVCYYLAKKLWLRIVSGIFVLLAFMTLVSQNTDSAYLAFAAMMLVLFFVAAETAEGMQRLCEIVFIFGIAPKLMALLLHLHPNETLDLDVLSMQMIFAGWTYAILVLALLLWLLFGFLAKKGIAVAGVMRPLRNISYICIAVLIAAAIVILKAGLNHSFSGVLLTLTEKVPYLVFDYNWGNGRGFTWSVSARMLREMSPKNLIFGVGPDCYPHYGYDFYAEMINQKWGDNVLQNAHNEWLNMIVNEGILGAVSYIGIFLSALLRDVKHREESPLILAVAVCIGAYMAHNLFCYQQVLCTPFIFLFIGLGEYQLRRSRPS